MPGAALKFGTPAREQVGRAIRAYVSAHFDSAAAAAKDLGISRQRLHSYMAGKSLPGADIFDKLAARWNVNLFGTHPKTRSKILPGKLTGPQMDLFRSPMILRNEHVEVVVKRKGADLIAEIKISASVRVA